MNVKLSATVRREDGTGAGVGGELHVATGDPYLDQVVADIFTNAASLVEDLLKRIYVKKDLTVKELRGSVRRRT